MKSFLKCLRKDSGCMDKLKNLLSQNKILILITLGGFLLRIVGLQFGQPFRYHPDELKLVYWAGNLLNIQNWSSDLFFLIGVYPPFYAFVLAVFFGIYSLFLLLTSAENISIVRDLYYVEPFQYHIIARMISAIAGTISIVVIYRIGKILSSKKAGLVSALFLATCFLHVRNSHFGSVDALLILLILMSFYFSAKILKSSAIQNYILAAIFVSAATATKWNAALVVLPFLAAHFMGDENKSIIKKIIDRKIWISAGVAAAAFFIFCPMVLVDFNEFWGGIIGTARFQQTGSTKFGAGGGFFSYFTGDHSPGYGFFYDNDFFASLGIFATLFFIAGFLLLIWRHKKTDLLLLLFPIVMYLVVGNMQYKAMRHVLPMVPFLLLIATEAVMLLKNSAKSIVFKRIILGIALGLIVLPSAWKSVRYDLALCQVDTRTEMKNWIEENISADTKIGVEEFHPPLLAKQDLNLDKIKRSSNYKRIYDVYGLVPKMFSHGDQHTDLHDPITYVIENQIKYLVLDSFTFDRYHWKLTQKKKPALVKSRNKFYTWIKENGRLLCRVETNNQYNISPNLELYELDLN
jgi:4-amino-4-deoxy-L-arabinose transferase-like glycosyltransferase